jgi:hypothetical protein
VSALLLALLLGTSAQEDPVASGRRAYDEARYEDAVRLLSEAMATAPSYDGLMTLGLAAGRLERLEEAGSAFDRAIALAPARPEGLVERGGLRFLEKRYDEAIQDLSRALEIHDDEYARDLLAASLHLAGRSEEALAQWNRLGRPILGVVSVSGLVRTRDSVARRELSLREGEVLDLDQLRESRLRLRQVGVFDRVTLRPVPQGGNAADLEVALTERHGLFRSKVGFLVGTGVHAGQGRVQLEYANLGGSGLSLGGGYRWQKNRPEAALSLSWPRPFGVPLYLDLAGVRGRQAYEVDGDAFQRRYRGLELGARHVLGARTLGRVAMRVRDRSFSEPRQDAPEGVLSGLEISLERTLLDRHRQRLEASATFFQAVAALGSVVSYPRGILRLSSRTHLSAPDGSSLEPSVLAARALWARGGSQMPIDDMFAPGGSADMELPLRAHRQTPGGVLGPTPLGRSLVLGNLEWRRRVLDRSPLQVGIVASVDAARVADGPQAGVTTLVDIGVGLRVSLVGSGILRVDYGHGLRDGNNAVFVGLGETF